MSGSMTSFNWLEGRPGIDICHTGQQQGKIFCGTVDNLNRSSPGPSASWQICRSG